MSDLLETPMSRRKVLQAATATALTIDPALRAAVYAGGSDKPEKEEKDETKDNDRTRKTVVR